MSDYDLMDEPSAGESLPVAIDRTNPRAVALVKALGLDKAAPEQVDLTLAIANRYDLDPMLKHITLIEGRPYITRDGLLSVAHRSKQLDGIEVTDPVITDVPGPGNSTAKFWTCKATVYRKDMSRPFTYPGRYPVVGGWNIKFAPEMAIKVAESMALRRAFNVAAPSVEERWDVEVPAEAAIARPERPALADVVASRLRDTGSPAEPVAGPVGGQADSVAGEPTPEAPNEPGPPAAPAGEGEAELDTAADAEVHDPAVVEEQPDRTGLSMDEFRSQARSKGILTGLAARSARELFPDRKFASQGDLAALTDDERLLVFMKALDLQADPA